MNKIKKILATVISSFLVSGAVGCTFFDKPLELSTPSISLNENIVTWNAVENAEGYVVSCNDVESQISSTTYAINATEFGDYTVKVKAYANDKETLVYSGFSNAVTYHKDLLLTAPVLTISDNNVSWNAVANASKYEVFVNGNSKGEQTTTSYTINETAFGDYKVTVKAIGMDGETKVTSAASNEVSYHVALVLSAPVISIQGKVVSWNAVANATKYEVFVNNASKGEQTTTSYTINETAFGDYKVTVKAIGYDGVTKVTSAASNEVSYHVALVLSAPTITLKGNVVSWTAVANASKYEVFVNGNSKGEQTTTSYTINETAFGDYKVTVKAIGMDGSTKVTSAASNEVNYHIALVLNKPTIALNGNVVSWTAVANATKYEVFVNGNSKGEQTATSYTISDTAGGEYKVTVKAVGMDGTTKVTSAASNEVRYVISTKLGTPAISASGTTISWTAVENATSYAVYVNDALKATITEATYTLDETTVGSYEMEVVAKSTSDLYTDSDRSNKATITILPTQLTAPVIERNENIISWNAVANATSYDVYDNSSLLGNVTSTSYTISTNGSHSIEVVAKPTSSQYSDSAKSNKIEFDNTLYTPDTTIYWSASSSATVSNTGSFFGLNAYSSSLSALNGGDVVKVCYCLDISSIGDSGTFTLTLLMQRETNGYAYVADGSVSANFSDLAVKTGQVVLSFVVQLPSAYVGSTDCICPTLAIDGTIECQLDWIYIMGDGYNCCKFPSYAFGFETKATTGSLAVSNTYTPSNMGDYTPDTNVYYKAASSYSCVDTGNFFGLNAYPSTFQNEYNTDALNGGKVVKFCFCLDITSIGDTGTFTFSALLQRSTDGYSTVASDSVTANFSDVAVKSGQVVISFVVQLPSNYVGTTDCISPSLAINGTINCQFDWIYIVGDGYNCGTFPEYAFGFEKRADNGAFVVTNQYTKSALPPYTPDTSIYYQASTSYSCVDTGNFFGLNAYPSYLNYGSNTDPLNGGKVVKFCFCLDITSIGDTGTFTFTALLQRATDGYSTVASDSITANFSDVAVKSGQVVISFVVQLPSNYVGTTDCISPSLAINGTINCQFDWIYIMGDGYNCGAFPEYAFGFEAVATTGAFVVTNQYAQSVVA